MFWNNTSAYKDGYLTFIALEDGTFSYSTASQYTIDDGKHWIDLPANTATPTIQAGNMISWRYKDISSTAKTFKSSNKFNAEGNVLSMKFGENFKQGNNRSCQSMFDGCSGLVSAENLIIPRNTANAAYQYLFRNCTNLEKAPALPVTSLVKYIYANMFQGCTSLTTAPALPATTLTNRCYESMFQGCTSLTTAPTLPATTLALRCYYYMFLGCTNLTYIKCLATNISASSCLFGWVYGVSSTGTFVKASGMEGWPRNTNGIPTGWTIEEE